MKSLNTYHPSQSNPVTSACFKNTALLRLEKYNWTWCLAKQITSLCIFDNAQVVGKWKKCELTENFHHKYSADPLSTSCLTYSEKCSNVMHNFKWHSRCIRLNRHSQVILPSCETGCLFTTCVRISWLIFLSHTTIAVLTLCGLFYISE